MLRFTRQLAHVDDECGKLEFQLNDVRQVISTGFQSIRVFEFGLGFV